MIYDNEQIMNIIDKAKKAGYISLEDILKHTSENSEDFNEIMKIVKSENLDIVQLNEEVPKEFDDTDDIDEFMDGIENDPNFVEFSSEIEYELKNKDIEDFVLNTTVVTADDPIKMYLKEIGQIPLLNVNRELELSRYVQDGIIALNAIEAINSGKKKGTAEDIEKYEIKVAEGQDAADILTESNLRLVVSIAKKFLGRGMQFQDLIQEGNMGLMKAVKKFDPTLGYKFSTYATWWIKQAITRAIADQARTIRIPVHMVETINRMIRLQRKLTQDLRREPTPDEIAKEMGISVEKVQQIQKIAQEPVSLETPVGEEDDSTLGDFVHDAETPNPLDYTMNEKFKEEIDLFLKDLTTREEKVIRLRYGLIDGRPRTLEEVGKEFNVTRERIRQIEAKALRRLRHPARQRILKCLKGYIN